MADDQLHKLHFQPDGTYRYQLAGVTQPALATIDESGVWSVDQRTLTLDHLDAKYRNVHFESATQLNLYASDTQRFACQQ